jgi:precorrin 3B synthase CobZ
MSLPSACDIIVIGGGNAGFSAALSAAQHNPKASIIIIDKCPESWVGGNSYFTAGAFRTVHNGLADLLPLVNNAPSDKASRIDIPVYSVADFANDLQRMTGGRTDPALSKILVEDSRDTVGWLAQNGIRFQFSFNRQAYEIDGRIKFWGGMALKTEDGGKGLIEDHLRVAQKHGIKVFFDTAATKLVTNLQTGAVVGVEVVTRAHEGKNAECQLSQRMTIEGKAVIMAAGGFEANPQLRAQYLGPGWDAAKVRGTPFNTGDLLQIAQRDVSAKAVGNWSGCHSVAWDADAPAHAGDRGVSNEFTKSGYPLGIMINRDGVRFVDEGSDMRNYTYAMIGRRILEQPGQIAFQIWDARTTPWLRSEEYRPEVTRHLTGDSLEELADRCVEAGLTDKERFLATLAEYNRSVPSEEDFKDKWDPTVKDGLSTKGLPVPKSNWALPIDRAPFLAVRVTSGITFTFGGLAVNPETAAVVSEATGGEIPGLYAVGEMLGGIFHDNYPGGSGLTSGAVFGRRAGRAASERVSVEGAEV